MRAALALPHDTAGRRPNATRLDVELSGHPMRDEDHRLIEATSFYAAVGKEAMAKLTRSAFVQVVPKGSILFLQGDMPRFVHLVLSGRISLGAESTAGHSTVVEIFRAGEFLVLAAAILRRPYLMTARALSESRVLKIPAEPFRDALDGDPHVSRALVDILANHWRLLVRQIKDLKLHSANERVATLLVAHADGVDGPATVQLTEDLRTVALRLGMTPESLSRAFTALRAHGVRSRGRTVTIEDVARLRAYCGYDDPDIDAK
ncbi:MAG: cyclic nucleotide-binding domain-containing protein [Alphaproteobacteria bacterium]|nr:cyclic nucleotide-binding domain-containing protein [Alphaproteobacteria bacterium]